MQEEKKKRTGNNCLKKVANTVATFFTKDNFYSGICQSTNHQNGTEKGSLYGGYLFTNNNFCSGIYQSTNHQNGTGNGYQWDAQSWWTPFWKFY